jgi:hypothetical protein
MRMDYSWQSNPIFVLPWVALMWASYAKPVSAVPQGLTSCRQLRVVFSSAVRVEQVFCVTFQGVGVGNPGRMWPGGSCTCISVAVQDQRGLLGFLSVIAVVSSLRQTSVRVLGTESTVMNE